jgi:hypothetical protein
MNQVFEESSLQTDISSSFSNKDIKDKENIGLLLNKNSGTLTIYLNGEQKHVISNFFIFLFNDNR